MLILIFKFQIHNTLSMRRNDNSNFHNFKFQILHTFLRERTLILIFKLKIWNYLYVSNFLTSSVKFFILILSELTLMLIFIFKFSIIFLWEQMIILIIKFQIQYIYSERSKNNSNFHNSNFKLFILFLNGR